MKTYTLKSIVRRGSMLGAAVAVVAATALPSLYAYADALNPLTERSLLLSSSSPGYAYSDGSGNSEYSQNAIGEYYAPPGSGPNGQKTGEVFTFTMSSTVTDDDEDYSTPSVTDDGIKGISFQYCTTAAGNCQAPGDNQGDSAYVAENDPYAGVAPRESNATAHPLGRSDLDIVGTFTEGATVFDPETETGGGNFTVYLSTDGGSTFSATSGWTFAKTNKEDTGFVGANGTAGDADDRLTGKNNYAYLTNDEGITLDGGDVVKIVFNASDAAYITNPGSGSFFVKINTYNTDNDALYTKTVPLASNVNVIDGGVTVANVMTDSIHITTKVLETMAFSVGTQNRDTVDLDGGNVHGTCDPITKIDNNRLNLGNPDAEYSLETTRAWDVYSYWRLSSNSSGGATVYYSGDTLRNTVGDYIDEIGASAAASTPGTNQFGIAFVDATADDLDLFAANSDGDQDFFDDNDASGTLTAGDGGVVATDPDSYRLPTLYVLNEVAAYNGGTGDINHLTLGLPDGGPGDAEFAFLSSSLTVPELIASNNEDVIRCDTAKMRYVGNIGADTPAGVYTTKINYLAAPQY